jgi:Fic family protein
VDPKAFRADAPGKLMPISDANEKAAFVPDRLPPNISLSKALVLALEEADHQLGSLNGVGTALHHPGLLIRPFMRREAVLSSKIEGTVASLSDLALYEADPTKDRRDAREVSNYVEALEFGLKRLRQRPLGQRLICEMHARLMTGLSGDRYAPPGQIRKQQVYIGKRVGGGVSARFVPPPASQVQSLLSDLERYINDPSPTLPLLARIALIHYQFEAIHPFRDGNGRIGRLLIMLLLGAHGRLTQPLLYPSAFFNANRDEYYDRLLRVSTEGAWEDWMILFFAAIAETAKDAVKRAQQIVTLHRRFRQQLIDRHAGDIAQRLLDLLFNSPAYTIPSAMIRLKSTYPTVQKATDKLIDAGIIAHVTGSNYPKIFTSRSIIKAVERDLDEGGKS